MSSSAYHTFVAPSPDAAAPTAAASRTRTLARIALLCGVAVAVGSVALYAHPAVPRDADLARLLRLMASLKAAMLVAAIAAIDWRLRRPTAPARAAAYVTLAWIASGAVTAMWMLAAIGTSAIVMHVAGAALVILAFTDRDFIPAPGSGSEKRRVSQLL